MIAARNLGSAGCGFSSTESEKAFSQELHGRRLVRSQRCQDQCGQLRRAAAVDELEQLVQVDLGVGGKPLRERNLEAGLAQDVATPGFDVWRNAAARRMVEVGVH